LTKGFKRGRSHVKVGPEPTPLDRTQLPLDLQFQRLRCGVGRVAGPPGKPGAQEV
jgi:hypothetical protein